MLRFGRIIEILYGQKNGVEAFGYNSADSEPIGIEIWNIVSQMLGADPGRFGRDPRSSDSLRGI